MFDEVIAILDGKSQGNMNTVKTTKKLDKPVEVVC